MGELMLLGLPLTRPVLTGLQLICPYIPACMKPIRTPLKMSLNRSSLPVSGCLYYKEIYKDDAITSYSSQPIYLKLDKFAYIKFYFTYFDIIEHSCSVIFIFSFHVALTTYFSITSLIDSNDIISSRIT